MEKDYLYYREPKVYPSGPHFGPYCKWFSTGMCAMNGVPCTVSGSVGHDACFSFERKYEITMDKQGNFERVVETGKPLVGIHGNEPPMLYCPECGVGFVSYDNNCPVCGTAGMGGIAEGWTIMTPCTWSEDEDGLFHTSCGQIHQFFNGGPEENKYRFCPFCGKELVEVEYEEYEGDI